MDNGKVSPEDATLDNVSLDLSSHGVENKARERERILPTIGLVPGLRLWNFESHELSAPI